MSEENPNTDLSSQSEYLEPEAYEPPSKTDAVAGTITEPGDTYESIRKSGRNYWVLPVFIAVMVGIISSFLFFSNDALVSNMLGKQKEKMEKSIDEKVNKGEMTREQGDDAISKGEKMMTKGPIMYAFGYGGAVVMPFFMLFIYGIIYFVVLKIMKTDVPFQDVLNVVGLAMIISSIGGILTIVVSMLMGDMQTLSLGLVLSENTVGDKLFTILSRLEFFSFWFYFVIALGLSKVSGISMGKMAGSVFGIWIGWILISTFVLSAFMR